MQQFSELDETWVKCLFGESPIPMALVSPDARFSRLNDSYCRLVGYSRGELLARTWLSITHPDDVDGDKAGADSLQSDHNSDVYTITKRYLTKHGEIVWVDLHVRSVWDGEKFVCFFVIANPSFRSAVHNSPAVPTKPLGYIEWIKRNPKDAALLGGAAVAVFGRDTIIELVRAILVIK